MCILIWTLTKFPSFTLYFKEFSNSKNFSLTWLWLNQFSRFFIIYISHLLGFFRLILWLKIYFSWCFVQFCFLPSFTKIKKYSLLNHSNFQFFLLYLLMMIIWLVGHWGHLLWPQEFSDSLHFWFIFHLSLWTSLLVRCTFVRILISIFHGSGFIRPTSQKVHCKKQIWN